MSNIDLVSITDLILFIAEESPPKKPKLDIQQQSSDNETPKSSNSNEPETKIDSGANSKKTQSDEESKDHPQCSSSPTLSSRNDLIRDIESHIEIIFECFDVDDTINTNTNASAAATKPESSSAESSNEIITSSEVSHEMDKTSSEKADETENEKKNEISSD